MGDDPQELTHDLERRFPRARLIGADAKFERLVAQVVGLLERPKQARMSRSTSAVRPSSSASASAP